MTFDPYAVESAFLALLSTRMFVISVMDNPMKMAKNVDSFSAGICPKYRVRGEFSRGVSLLMGVGRGLCPLTAHAIWGFSDPTHTSGR